MSTLFHQFLGHFSFGIANVVVFEEIGGLVAFHLCSKALSKPIRVDNLNIA